MSTAHSIRRKCLFCSQSGHNVNNCNDPRIDELHDYCISRGKYPHIFINSCDTKSIIGLAGKHRFPSKWGITGKRLALIILYTIHAYDQQNTMQFSNIVLDVKTFMNNQVEYVNAPSTSFDFRSSCRNDILLKFIRFILDKPEYTTINSEMLPLRNILRRLQTIEEREQRIREYNHQRNLDLRNQLAINAQMEHLNTLAQRIQEEHRMLNYIMHDREQFLFGVADLEARTDDIERMYSRLQQEQQLLNAVSVSRQIEYRNISNRPIETVKYNILVTQNDSDNIDSECPICYEIVDSSTTTNCNHVFCAPCIKNAIISSKNKCPMCRQPITALHVATNHTSHFEDIVL
jgi:hypothetical protein